MLIMQVVLLKIKSLLHLNVAWNSLGSTAGHDTEAGSKSPHPPQVFSGLIARLLLHLRDIKLVDGDWFVLLQMP